MLQFLNCQNRSQPPRLDFNLGDWHVDSRALQGRRNQGCSNSHSKATFCLLPAQNPSQNPAGSRNLSREGVLGGCSFPTITDTALSLIFLSYFFLFQLHFSCFSPFICTLPIKRRKLGKLPKCWISGALPLSLNTLKKYPKVIKTSTKIFWRYQNPIQNIQNLAKSTPRYPKVTKNPSESFLGIMQKSSSKCFPRSPNFFLIQEKTPFLSFFWKPLILRWTWTHQAGKKN